MKYWKSPKTLLTCDSWGKLEAVSGPGIHCLEDVREPVRHCRHQPVMLLVAGQGGVETGDEGLGLELRHGPGEPRVQRPHQGALGPGQGEQRHRAGGQEPLPRRVVLPRLGLHVQRGHQPHLLVFPGEVFTGDALPHEGSNWPQT